MTLSIRMIITFGVAAIGLAFGTFALPSAKGASTGKTEVVPRRAFLAQSNLADVQLSATGSHIAFLKRDGERRSLWLLDTSTGTRRQLARHNEADSLHWSKDGQWLFLVSARTVSAVSVGEGAGGGVLSLLGGESGRSVLGVDPSVPAAILVREDVKGAGERQPSLFRVLRLTASEVPEMLFTSRERVEEFIPGTPSFARVVGADHFSIRTVDRSGHAREVLRCVHLEQCSLLSSPRAGEALLTGDVGGNLERLLRLKSDGSIRTLHQDPEKVADIDAVALDPLTGEALLASYRSKGSVDYALGAQAEAHVAAIRRQLAPGSAFRLSVGKSHWLVAETNDRLQHARWHLYDVRTGRLGEILGEIEQPVRRVPESAAADRDPISFRASDGMLIHGFLSLPPGRDASQVPLVVHAHGGPWSHVADGYSTTTQFLVSRGYAVFEPNFRGSTGYGRAYMFAGKQDFGNGRVQQDIIEGTRFLLSRGVGDPRRVGIAGFSFGGYSVLQGVTFAPELFRVGIAGMPPSDFGWIMRWQVAREAAAGHDGIALKVSLKEMGINPADPALAGRLAAQSPLANVGRLKRPLLVVAGGADSSVPIRSVVHYAARLKSLGHQTTFFVDQESGHRMENPETQEQFLFLMSRMLHSQIAGASEPPLDLKLHGTLKRKLRIDDFALANTHSWGPSAGINRNSSPREGR